MENFEISIIRVEKGSSHESSDFNAVILELYLELQENKNTSDYL